MSKCIAQLLGLSLVVLFTTTEAAAQFQPSGQQPQQGASEPYTESALRRFEIITLSSLPFAAVHSYAVVRGIKMYTENQFAPELVPRDYRIIGAGAAGLALFIGLWDWLHTRNVDTSVPRIPERTAPEPPEEEEPTEGPVARLSTINPDTVRYRKVSGHEAMDRGLNRWAHAPAAGLTVPLIQIRF